MASPSEYAVETSRILNGFIAISDEIFAPPLWRLIRRALPVPLIFERIPYGSHARRLNALRQELEDWRRRAGGELDSAGSEDRRAYFRCFTDYSQVLIHTISKLEEICDGLADAAENRHGPSWALYQRHLAEFERLRAVQVKLGQSLNAAYALVRDEA